MNSPPINDLSGKVLTTDKEKAIAFQEKFVSVFTPMRDTPIDWPSTPTGLNTIKFDLVNVSRAINRMKRCAAPGSDQIGPIFYKECDISVVKALVDLFNHILTFTDIPGDFLNSVVIALWKNKGLISDILTYRGITLSCTALKIFESVILEQINAHLERNNFIDSWQHGFQKRKSTVTNLVSSWEFLSHEIDIGNSWVSLSLDFSCAFDTASVHHVLLSLKRRGIGGDLGRFLDKWLKNRTQHVKVGEELSDTRQCSSGVAQGSISGPQFFCCLLSDVFDTVITDGATINVRIYAFADDTRFLFQMKDSVQAEEAQVFLNTINHKIKESGLKLNAGKSVMVYYGNANYRKELSIDGCVIPVENQSLELGCVFANSLSFKPQLERSVAKAFRFIFMIRNTLKVRNFQTLKKLYQVYFCPILLYSCMVWVSDYNYARESLYKVYRAFWRLGNGYIVPDETILDPYQLALKHSLSFLYQIKSGKTCLDFEYFFTRKESEVTRSDTNDDLFIRRNRLQSRNSFFTTFIAKWYNKLPIEVKNAESLSQFKDLVDAFLKREVPTPNYSFLPWFRRY